MIRALLFGSLLAFSTVVVCAGELNMFRKVNDFDGDGRADFAVIRDQSGNKIWYVWQTTGGLKGVHFGAGFDISSAGDYNGDGMTDFAVFRDTSTFPPLWSFHILESGTNFYTIKTFTDFGNFGYRIAHQDYDGDGRIDSGINLGEFGLFTRTYIQYSGPAGGGTSIMIPPREVPIRIGDMDGDGKADIAQYHFETNVVTIHSSINGTTRTIPFGIFNDRYLMADFDGDAIGDLTVFRSSTGTWWWIQSSNGEVRAAKWGMSGDIPVPADYDGDGKTDLAIWRSGAQSAYWVLGSQVGQFYFPWGISGDRVVAY